MNAFVTALSVATISFLSVGVSHAECWDPRSDAERSIAFSGVSDATLRIEVDQSRLEDSERIMLQLSPREGVAAPVLVLDGASMLNSLSEGQSAIEIQPRAALENYIISVDGAAADAISVLNDLSDASPLDDGVDITVLEAGPRSPSGGGLVDEVEIGPGSDLWREEALEFSIDGYVVEGVDLVQVGRDQIVEEPDIIPSGGGGPSSRNQGAELHDSIALLTYHRGAPNRPQYCNATHLGHGVFLTNLHCINEDAQDFVLWFGAVSWRRGRETRLNAREMWSAERACSASIRHRPARSPPAQDRPLDFGLLFVDGAMGRFARAVSELSDMSGAPVESTRLNLAQIWPEGVPAPQNYARGTRTLSDSRTDRHCFARRPDPDVNPCRAARSNNGEALRSGGRPHGCDTAHGASGAPIFVHGDIDRRPPQIIGLHRGGSPGDPNSAGGSNGGGAGNAGNCFIPVAEFRNDVQQNMPPNR